MRFILYFIMLVLIQSGCTSIPAKEQNIVRSSDNCSFGIWEHVYNPVRLRILDSCKVVRGVVVESNEEDDGDEHMLLKLDKGQESLLTSRNMSSKRGCLVIEAICVNNISKKKVGNSCEGSVNNIELPKLNEHIEVTGTYVIDSHNGWAEIHPISKLEIIK
ncbi:MAG: hypothetical protein NVSMB45_04850 [Ginsengibacter sp.]